MGRPRGSRNADYDQKRRRLARKVVTALLASPSEHLSLRELARVAGVSVSTMRHYFGDRDGIIAAALAEMGQTCERLLAEARTRAADRPLAERLETLLLGLAEAWTSLELGRAQAVGLAEGVYASVGVHAVEHLLEPCLTSVEEELARELGIDAAAARHDALALLGPMWLALSHQESLGGRPFRPLDVPAFVRDHVGSFVRGRVASRAA